MSDYNHGHKERSLLNLWCPLQTYNDIEKQWKWKAIERVQALLTDLERAQHGKREFILRQTEFYLTQEEV